MNAHVPMITSTTLSLRRAVVLHRANRTLIIGTPRARQSFGDGGWENLQTQEDRDDFAMLVRIYRQEFPIQIIIDNSPDEPIIDYRMKM